MSLHQISILLVLLFMLRFDQVFSHSWAWTCCKPNHPEKVLREVLCLECKKELAKQRDVGTAKLVEGHTPGSLEARAGALHGVWSMLCVGSLQAERRHRPEVSRDLLTRSCEPVRDCGFVMIVGNCCRILMTVMMCVGLPFRRITLVTGEWTEMGSLGPVRRHFRIQVCNIEKPKLRCWQNRLKVAI